MAHGTTVVPTLATALEDPDISRSYLHLAISHDAFSEAKKVKCVVDREGVSCHYCSARKTSCSYVRKPTREIAPGTPSAAPDLGFIVRPGFDSGTSHPSPNYRLTDDEGKIDIGLGRPQDVLRERELAQSLLLLYFDHFADVHFMFDEELFLRQFLLGEVPEVLLYSIMALSIRFSHAPFRDESAPCNRGELFFDHARQLLERGFDNPSITNAQALVLLSTYKITYGGSRQAYVLLSLAATMMQVLHLDEQQEPDTVSTELNRRLVCTILLMDQLLSLPIRLPTLLPEDVPLPSTMSEDEFWALKHRVPTQVPSEANHGKIYHLMVQLSRIIHKIGLVYRNGGSVTELQRRKTELDIVFSTLNSYYRYDRANLTANKERGTLRRFAFLHLLYHHAGQLVTFCSLRSPETSRTEDFCHPEWEVHCYQHAQSIADIIKYTFAQAGFDLHNLQMGQILTVATIVHAHARMMASSHHETERLSFEIATIQNCVDRLKIRTRMYNWVIEHLEGFWEAFNQNQNTPGEIYDQNSRLVSEVLCIGSQWGTLPLRVAGAKPQVLVFGILGFFSLILWQVAFG